MRLNKKDINIIIKAIKEFSNNYAFELFLFASRVDDNKLGGDIDLLLLSDKHLYFLKNKYKIINLFKKKLEEQKVDLLIKNLKNIENDIFFKNIYKDAIKLI